MSFTTQTDQDLMADLRSGRDQALAVLFARYGRLVFQVAKQILHDEAEGEDLVQEVFLEVYRKAALYDSSKGSVKTWLLQYAYHRSFNRRKYLALRHFYDANPASAEREAEWSGEAKGRQGLTPREWGYVLRKAMEQLSANESRIVSLVAFDGLTPREAAERIGESYVNGRNLYYRGLNKLRQLLCNPTLGREVDDVRS